VGGIADNPKRGEGEPGFGGVVSGDMAFHVDGGSTGFEVQRLLEMAGRDHLFSAGQPSPDDAPAIEPHTFHQSLVQGETGQPTGVARKHLGRHNDVPGLQGRIQSPGNAEADDPPDRVGIEYREQRAQLLRIATAAYDSHAGPGSDPSLLHQSSHNEYRPRINRGGAVPRPQLHIPTPTTALLLVFRKFRYRANAQSGKNFE